MNHSINIPLTSELLHKCTAFHRELGCVVNIISNLEERLSNLEFDYFQLMQAMNLLPAMQAHAALEGKTGKRSRELRKMLMQKAEKGVDSVRFTPQPDGGALMQFNNQTGLRLTPELADLAAVLTAQEGTSRDDLVPWRSLATVKAALLSRTGRKIGSKAVHQAVYRLRELLAAHGENPFYVMSDRTWGYRFALRRTQTDVTLPVTARNSAIKTARPVVTARL